MNSMRFPRRLHSLLGLALVPVLLSGCFNPFSPEVLTKRVTVTAPQPNSPEEAVQLFEWCWVNRGVEEYKELFTDDYVFQSALLDSAGNGGRDVITRRSDEIETAENMFIGSADRPPAAKITLNFDGSLRPQSDPRPNHPDSLYKTIRTSVDLKVDVEDGNVLEVTGHALFFLVRGDVALIPQELKSRIPPSRNRWWIERWEDETLPESGVTSGRARPMSAHWVMNIAQVKRYYLGR